MQVDEARQPEGAEAGPVDLRADTPAALLIAVGVAALLDLVTVVGRAALPAWRPSPLLPLAFGLIALLAFYRHRWTRLYRPFGNRVPIYLAELVLLVVLTRLLPLLADPAGLLARLPTWLAEPATLFDAPFVVDLILVGAAWLAGHSLGSAVDGLHLQSGELTPPGSPADQEGLERVQGAFDHRAGHKQITNHVGGAGLVAVLGLALLPMVGASGGLLIEGFVAAGLTLLCGLLLLAWSHLLLLDTLWRVDGLRSPPALGRRWPGWLLLVLATAALLALIAPRTYALDPLQLVIVALQLVVGIIQLLLFLIALPFIWLASLLGLSGGAAATPPPMAMPVAEGGSDNLAWLAALRSLAFWGLTLGLVVYALRTLYQSRWGLLGRLPRLTFLAGLARLWRSLWSGLRQRAVDLAALLRPEAARAAAALRRPPGLPRPSDPRGWVQFLYLSLIERAGRRGYPRRRGMTAAEYSRYLAAQLTTATAEGADPVAARADLDELTAAYLTARYSQRPVEEAEVGPARRALQRLLEIMRRLTTSRR